MPFVNPNSAKPAHDPKNTVLLELRYFELPFFRDAVWTPPTLRASGAETGHAR